MNEQETIADIIAEKRRQADKIEREMFGVALVADIRCEADRLEAAWKRESGNAAKLREALERCRNCAQMIPPFVQASKPERSSLNAAADYANLILRDVADGLAAPPRNCDKVKTSWEVLKEWHEGLDTANDIVRMLDWLLAPAKEKEGGAK